MQLLGSRLKGTVYLGKNDDSIIKGAQVTIDGKARTVTDSKGQFNFGKIEFGKHTLQIIAGKLLLVSAHF